MRVKITLRCNECKQRNYNTVKTRRMTPIVLNEEVLQVLQKAHASQRDEVRL